MTLDCKVKRATLEISLRHLLRGARKFPERTARNLLEFGATLAKQAVDDKECEALCAQLIPLLQAAVQEEIMTWMLERFDL